MGVVVGVIHDLVPGVRERLNALWVSLRPLADNEKGRPDIVLSENINKQRGVLITPCGVEGETDHLLVAFYGINGQLTL